MYGRQTSGGCLCKGRRLLAAACGYGLLGLSGLVGDNHHPFTGMQAGEVRLGGQITIQDKAISGDKKQGPKLCSDPQAAVAEAKYTDI
jgi:hypothetical protein